MYFDVFMIILVTDVYLTNTMIDYFLNQSLYYIFSEKNNTSMRCTIYVNNRKLCPKIIKM